MHAVASKEKVFLLSLVLSDKFIIKPKENIKTKSAALIWLTKR